MKQPIAVEVREGAGYITYSVAAPVTTIDITETGSVAFDVSERKEIVGIEILDVAAADQVDAARKFAEENRLGFPADLRGVLTDEPRAAYA